MFSHFRRMQQVLLSVVAASAIAVPAAAQTRPDTTHRADSTAHFSIEPINVVAARERAAPPPISTIRVPARIVQRTQAANPFDLLRRVAPVEVHEQGQGPGFASDVVVRGFTSDHSADVLLVVDGVPVNLPIHGHGEGYADWNVLLPGAISSFRLIHGTASPLYGNFALGGVVEVFTHADADGSAGAVNASGQGDVGGWLRTGRRTDSGGSLFAADVRRNEGWRENDDYLLGNALLRGWRKVGDARIEGGLSLYTTEWNSPGFVSIADYNADALGGATDRSDGGDARRATLHGRFSRPLGDGRALQIVAWGAASDWRMFLNIPGHGDVLSQSGERDRRFAAGTQAEYVLIGSAGEATVGVSADFHRAEYRIDRTEHREPIVAEVRRDGSYNVAAAYARWRRAFHRLALDVGGRADVFRYGTRDGLATSPEWEDASSIVLSPKLGARYDFSPSVALMATSSRGFRGAVGVLEDPDRPPVLAWAQELGAEYRAGAFDVHVSLFRLDVSNERTQDPITREISSSGTSVRQGVDAHIEARFGMWRAQVGGTWNDATLGSAYADAHEDHETAASLVPAASRPRPRFHVHPTTNEGEWVPGVARYTAHVATDGAVGEQLAPRAALRIVGPYIPIGEPDVRTRPYTVIDAGFSWLFTPETALDVDLQNIAGLRYPELRASGFVNPGAPRTLRVALRMN